MADPVSLTMSAVALDSLFSNCVECFDYFIAAKSFQIDFEILLVKLDLEKTRLLIWGNSVGILRSNDEPEGRAAELGEVPKAELIARCLESIKSLLSDADKLQDRYGLQKSNGSRAKKNDLVSSNSMNVFKTSYNRFWVRFAKDHDKTSMLSRTRWAIHDRAKFEDLIRDLKHLVDSLNEVSPTYRKSQDQVVKRDISSILDIANLRLVRAASEASYPSWAREAERVIEASEKGTVDRRLIEEWVRDAEGIDEQNEAQVSEPDIRNGIDELDLDLGALTSIFFVFTDQCQNILTGNACGQADLGEVTLANVEAGFEAVRTR